MRVITEPNYYEPHDKDVSVFLAGGITNCPNWQKKVIETIKNTYSIVTDSLVLFNPRRDNFPIHDKSAASQQIEWEFDMIEKCNVFSMYFSSGESDQPICMYELGRNILRMQMRYPADWQDRIIVSVEDGYHRIQDVLIQTELATNGKIPINHMVNKEMCLENHINDILKTFIRFR